LISQYISHVGWAEEAHSTSHQDPDIPKRWHAMVTLIAASIQMRAPPNIALMGI
jgi:hypothetical protein